VPLLAPILPKEGSGEVLWRQPSPPVPPGYRGERRLAAPFRKRNPFPTWFLSSRPRIHSKSRSHWEAAGVPPGADCRFAPPNRGWESESAWSRAAWTFGGPLGRHRGHVGESFLPGLVSRSGLLTAVHRVEQPLELPVGRLEIAFLANAVSVADVRGHGSIPLARILSVHARDSEAAKCVIRPDGFCRSVAAVCRRIFVLAARMP